MAMNTAAGAAQHQGTALDGRIVVTARRVATV
jgi:hypothetical protein